MAVDDGDADALATDLELIQSSLLPAESLVVGSTWPREIAITSADSAYALKVAVGTDYPAAAAVRIEVKGKNDGRGEAEEWSRWSRERMAEWDAESGCPLYQILTAHFMPLLAPPSRSPSPSPPTLSVENDSQRPHHALLTSHHLLSPTKRRDFLALASSLSLTGFSKVGHPGIYYAIGARADVESWVREVKSWNWLALRVRVAVEPVTDDAATAGGRGAGEGARGGKGRGDWCEVEKIGDAVEWMRARGREAMLFDIGIGGQAR